MIRRPYLTSPITHAQLNAADALLGDLHDTLSPLPNLTKADRKQCIKVGDNQAAFMEEIFALCKANPKVMPQWHDLNDFYACMESLENLRKLQLHMMSIMEAIDGALLGAKHDAMVYCLDYFHNLKIASKGSVPGLGKHLEKAKGHFKGGNRKKKEEQIPDAIQFTSDQAVDAAHTERKAILVAPPSTEAASSLVEESATAPAPPNEKNSPPPQFNKDSTSKQSSNHQQPKPKSHPSRAMISKKGKGQLAKPGHYRKRSGTKGGNVMPRRKARPSRGPSGPGT